MMLAALLFISSLALNASASLFGNSFISDTESNQFETFPYYELMNSENYSVKLVQFNYNGTAVDVLCTRSSFARLNAVKKTEIVDKLKNILSSSDSSLTGRLVCFDWLNIYKIDEGDAPTTFLFHGSSSLRTLCLIYQPFLSFIRSLFYFVCTASLITAVVLVCIFFAERY